MSVLLKREKYMFIYVGNLSGKEISEYMEDVRKNLSDKENSYYIETYYIPVIKHLSKNNDLNTKIKLIEYYDDHTNVINITEDLNE